MTTTIFKRDFCHATAGNAHGSVSIGHVAFVGEMALASLAFVSQRNPALLESPIYSATFAPTPKGQAAAKRALMRAAKRHELTAIGDAHS